MYCEPNFKSKKELKQAIADGKTVTVFSPGSFHCPQNGTVFLEGPHYPKPHKWYAQATIENGIVKSVK